MARRNIWEQIWESTEGPTVTVTIPRDHAESLLRVLAASLEQDIDMDDMGDDDDGEDLDSVHDLDFGGDEHDMGPPEDDDMDGMADLDLDFMPAGDDDEDDEPGPKKKGPGRPPGSKNKKKDDDGDDENSDKDDDSDSDDDDDDDKKEESAGDYRPQTALGESSFSKLNRALKTRKGS